MYRPMIECRNCGGRWTLGETENHMSHCKTIGYWWLLAFGLLALVVELKVLGVFTVAVWEGYPSFKK